MHTKKIDRRNHLVGITGVLLLSACGSAGSNDAPKPKSEIAEFTGTTLDAISPRAGGTWSLVDVVESPHPYANGYTDTFEVRGRPETVEMRVVFERFELERGYDFVYVTDGTGAQRTAHTGNKTGHDIVIEGAVVRLLMQTDGSVTGHGFRARIEEATSCICVKILAPVCGVDEQTYDNQCFAECAGVEIVHPGACDPAAWFSVAVPNGGVESAHPYENNFRNTWVVREGGARFIRGHFERVDVERGYDFLRVLDANDRVVATYSGIGEDFTTPVVSGDTLKIELVTDESVRRYGFKLDRYEVIGGCVSNAECPVGEACAPVVCVRAPCFNTCQPTSGPINVRVSDLLTDPARYDGQIVRVVGEPEATRAACTRRACPTSDPCCNRCSSTYWIDELILEGAPGVPFGCTGDTCNPAQSCEPFAGGSENGPYAITGRFESRQGSPVLVVDSFVAVGCQHTGCSSHICANAQRISTCEWREEYACYQRATCEAQADGHCGFTATPELAQCLAGPREVVFTSGDTPLTIPDAEPRGVTSQIEVTGGQIISELAVSVNISHPYRGDLQVVLVGPNGAETSLADRQGGSADDLVLSNVIVPEWNGSVADGVWRLIVRDLGRADVGSLTAWSLAIR